MWDQVVLRYNVRRPRGMSKCDFEVGKPKPSGVNDHIAKSTKTIAKAQDIHRALELKAGSSDYNDGLDEGEDDEELLLHVGGVCDENQSRALKRTVYEVEETAIHDGSLVPA
ncbi:hypothetical protein L915_21691 [Phytophthora nicotianae]|nr:hypothetical protein L915_21691 [Phytophthora nicotianae]ETL24435.1 hypothetical protein L916_21563 [Phytophthora nicotianae]